MKQSRFLRSEKPPKRSERSVQPRKKASARHPWHTHARAAWKRLLGVSSTASDTDPLSEERRRMVALYGKDTLLKYLLLFCRESLPYKLLKTLFSYIRRYRTAVLIIQLVLFAVTFSGNGILLLIGTAGVALLLPILLALSVLLLQQFSTRRRRELRTLSASLCGCTALYIVPLPQSVLRSPSDGLLAFYASLSSEPHTAVLLITPFLLSFRSIRSYSIRSRIPGSPFSSAKPLMARCFLIRAPLYFRLKRFIDPALYQSRTVLY